MFTKENTIFVEEEDFIFENENIRFKDIDGIRATEIWHVVQVVGGNFPFWIDGVYQDLSKKELKNVTDLSTTNTPESIMLSIYLMWNKFRVEKVPNFYKSLFLFMDRYKLKTFLKITRSGSVFDFSDRGGDFVPKDVVDMREIFRQWAFEGATEMLRLTPRHGFAMSINNSIILSRDTYECFNFLYGNPSSLISGRGKKKAVCGSRTVTNEYTGAVGTARALCIKLGKEINGTEEDKASSIIKKYIKDPDEWTIETGPIIW